MIAIITAAVLADADEAEVNKHNHEVAQLMLKDWDYPPKPVPKRQRTIS